MSSAVFDGLADEAFVLAAAVHVGGIEKVEPKIQSPVDGGNGFGVHSAMPSRTAHKLCTQGIFVRPNMKKYGEVSTQVMAILETFTPLVQPVSIDEAFLDVTGSTKIFGDALTIAKRIKAEIHAQTGLTASVGVAPNKFLAKLASDLKKPDGLMVITEANKVEMLAPLPVSKIWGVGKVTEKRLHEVGLHTIGGSSGCLSMNCAIASVTRRSIFTPWQWVKTIARW